MGDAGEDVINTHHGDLPGHIQKEWEDRQVAPAGDDYTIVTHKWNNIWAKTLNGKTNPNVR